MIAFYLAFKTLGGEHTPADDKSYSNDHYELESSNPPDTVLVATFLENKFTSNKNIKKQYIYGCKFTDKLAGKEVFLLFSIFWDPVFRCWRRLPNDCCCGASSLEEATDWMLERTFKRTFNIKGNFADYFKKWKLDIKIGKGAGSKNPLEIKELRRFLIICLYVLCLVSVFSGGGVPWVFHYIVPITIGPIIFLP